MKKIAMIAKNLELNGISTVIMNYSTNLDSSKFQITIFAGNDINEEYLKQCQEKNINVVQLYSKNKNAFKYYFDLLKKMKSKKYDICHVHGNSSSMVIELLIAKIKKIKVRIAHCHAAKCNNIRLHKILAPIFKKSYTTACACSEEAGKWIFDNFTVVSNGIDLKKYKFDLNVRNKIRKRIGVKESDILIGHIGRINNQKNQIFLVDLIEKLYLNSKNIKLIFVGNGPEYENLDKYIKSKKGKDNIILYGETNNVYQVYSAIDIFAFPSKYEGLGIAAIEAQANGVNCIVSENLPNDIIVTEKIKKLPLKIELWENEITKLSSSKLNIDKRNIFEINNLKRFSIKENIRILEKIYLCNYNKEKNK